MKQSARYSEGIETGQDRSGRRILSYCLLLAVFLGVAFRFYFSPDRVSFWLTESFSRSAEPGSPVKKWDLARAQLSLADGLFPELAVAIYGLHIRLDGPCPSGTKLRINRVHLPLSVSGLLQGQLKWNRVDIGKLEVEPDRHCLKPLSSPQPSLNAQKGRQKHLSTEEALNLLPSSLQQPSRWLGDLMPLHRLMEGLLAKLVELFPSGVRVDEVIWLDDFNNIEWTAKDFRMKHKKGIELDVQSDLALSHSLYPDIVYPKLDLHFTWRQGLGLKLETQGQWKEGELKLDFSAPQPQPGAENWKFDLLVKNMSVESLLKVSFPEKKEMWDLKQPKFAWLNCSIHGVSSAAPSDPNDSTVSETSREFLWADECRIIGDLGQWTIEGLRYLPSAEQEHRWSSFAVNIEEAPLDIFLAQLTDFTNWPSLQKLGFLTGKLSVDSLTEWHWQGQLQKTAFLFSNLGVRSRQLVEAVNLDLTRSADELKGSLSDFKLPKGSVAGEVSLRRSFASDETWFQVDLDQVVLDPQIQELMAKGSVGDISVQALVKLLKADLQYIKGKAYLQSLGGDFVQAKGVTLPFVYKEQRWVIDPQVKLLKFQPEMKSYSLVAELLPEASGPVSMSHVKGKLVGERQQFSWKNLRGQLKDLSAIGFKTSGRWDSIGNLFGRLTIDFPGQKFVVWQLSGNRDLPALKKLEQSSHASKRASIK